jgi:3-methyladenine DNA glycosylase/8-oxoguanine DNA glycosylase
VTAKLRAAEKHLAAVEPRFARVIAAAGPCALKKSRDFDPFDSLSGSIISQQLSGKAARTIYGRVPALFGQTTFPTAAQVLAAPPEFLRPAGVSGAKAVAIRDLAAKVLDGTVPAAADLHRLDDETLVERISQVRGIGRWTVEMLLIFDLGRLDVFPTDDLGVRNGYAKLFRRHGAKPREMLRRAEAWRPYRSVASWYLWRVTDTPGAVR